MTCHLRLCWVCVYGIIPWELSSITSSSQSKTVYVVEAIIKGTLRKHWEIRKPRVACHWWWSLKWECLKKAHLTRVWAHQNHGGLSVRATCPLAPFWFRGHGRTLPNNFCVVMYKFEGLLQNQMDVNFFWHTYLHYEEISFYCHQTVGWNFVPFNFISCYTYDSHTSRHDAIAMLVLCRLGRQIPLDHAIISIAGKNQFSIIMHAMLICSAGLAVDPLPITP